MCIHHSLLHANNTGRWQKILEAGNNQRNWQDISMPSRFSYSLIGTFIPNPQATDKPLIFLHGFTESRLSWLSYLNFYLNVGYNLLLVDSRAHGESGGESVTWGVYEKYDVDQWVDWLRNRYPAGTSGMHGISMGAATALLRAGLNESNKRVAFYIADSSYADFESLLTDQGCTAGDHAGAFHSRRSGPAGTSASCLSPFASSAGKNVLAANNKTKTNAIFL